MKRKPQNDGLSYNIDNFTDKVECAKVWSENDKSLEELLLFLWESKIKTRACCAHNKYVYLQVSDLVNSNLGGLFSLVKNGKANIDFGILHVDYKKELFDGYFMAIYENRDNKCEDFFSQVKKSIEEQVPFQIALRKFNSDLNGVFDLLNEKQTGPFFTTPRISRIQFVAEQNRCGVKNVMTECFEPISKNKEKCVKRILNLVKMRENFVKEEFCQ